MLIVKTYLQPEESLRGFDQDLESFTIAASMGIPSLADRRGVAMVNDDHGSQIDALWDSLELSRERAGQPVRWRAQGCSIVMDAAERNSFHTAVEANVIPKKSLASFFDKKTQ